ncbi:oligoketide cyclase [Parvularcula bermudensis HTCC2503]|uniref:Oligoketide cyclase n=1 Tax=Parvularcula bermudensis (strain ATCC BAA-594 / HTCC2503 / KCTC 12087) TaxID=314260 RepID=E0TIB8_PARBH|nr:type II toxin-antitoxin system RatA family toxin [Parvularcula bermudensis]ADM09702.1 oligoketide cyclase [Parvularcula bermudensis HTCC2503]
MGHHQERTFVPFTPTQMFDLVAAVEDYPRFIPWIEALRVKERKAEHLVADMIVKYTIFRESFRSRVALDRPNMAIDVDYIRGPLKSLSNHWRFEKEPNGCTIDFCIDFEFKNPLLQTVANQLIDKAFRRLSSAFTDEAHRRYQPIAATASKTA